MSGWTAAGWPAVAPWAFETACSRMRACWRPEAARVGRSCWRGAARAEAGLLSYVSGFEMWMTPKWSRGARWIWVKRRSAENREQPFPGTENSQFPGRLLESGLLYWFAPAPWRRRYLVHFGAVVADAPSALSTPERAFRASPSTRRPASHFQ